MIKLRQLIDFLRDDIIQIYGLDEDIEIEGIAALNNSDAKYLDWIHQNSKHSQEKAESSKSKVIIANQDVVYNNSIKSKGKVLIQVKNPYLTIAKIGNEFFVSKEKPIIHPTDRKSVV